MGNKSSNSGNTRKLKGDEDFDGLKRATKSLPADYYRDQTWYEHELDKIFYRNWVYLCHGSSLAEARSYRRFSIGRQEIFVLRGDDGELRGYHNTCRHRGSLLCQEQAGKFERKMIRCPYHQWAYDLDGKLLATSSLSEAPDFEKSDYPLFKVSIKEWKGAIFVSLGDDPPDMEQGFKRGSDRINNWPMADLVVGHRWSKLMQCNWKIFWENFNECLHCPNVHPELCELVPIYGRRISYFRDAADWPSHEHEQLPKYSGGLREGATSWSHSGNACDEPFAGLSAEEIERGQSYFVSLPSVYIAAHVDYMRTVRVLPLGPEQTEIEVEWLFRPETLARDDFNLADITEFAILVMQQDADASELNQKGLHSKAFKQGVLMPEDHHVKGFQDWVRAQTDGEQ